MNIPIKILITIRQGKIGGGESHVLDLVKHLDRTQYEPIVLSFTDGPMINTLTEWGVKTHVIYTERPFNFLVWKKVYRFFVEEGVELVHAHGTRANSNVFWAAKKLKLPIIYTVHGWSFHQDQNFFLRTMREAGEWFLIKQSKLTICVSKSNLKDGQERVGLTRSTIINYGIDLDKFDPNKKYANLKQELNVAPDETLVGYIARITIQKDPHTLIMAIAEILKNTSKIKFLVIGNGDLKESTLALAKKLNVESHITFQDFRQDTPNVLSGIDIYCLPSLWEGLPIGLLEAMAMRKAVVATPVDGTKEAVVDQFSGVLVPHQSPTDLANAIIHLHENKNLITQYGESAHQTVEQRFEVKRMVQEVEKIYESFLGKVSGATGRKPMRIGIEAQRLFREKKHGLEIVAMEIIRHLQVIDKVNQYVVFVRKDVDNTCIQETPNFKIREIEAGSFPEWEQIKLPRAIKEEKIDLLHCTANTAPLFTSVPIILTLHDIIFLEETKFTGNSYQNIGNIYRKLIVKQVIRKIKKVLTVSNSERDQILNHLSINPTKLSVVYNAVDQSFKRMSAAETDPIRKKYNLPKEFILFFGNSAQKKNSLETLKGYVEYCQSSNAPPLPLVVAGAFEEYLKDQLDEINPPVEIRSNIITTGYIPFKEQPAIYNLASLFLYTSKRESFGLPIIESMACGTPVITSQISSMPEVAGNAAHLVDPNDKTSIGLGISKVLSEVSYRNSLIEVGYTRAKEFSWVNTAIQLLKIYESTFDEERSKRKANQSNIRD
jgi:glycosyltransferase involved in cell wall biosynthesis